VNSEIRSLDSAEAFPHQFRRDPVRVTLRAVRSALTLVAVLLLPLAGTSAVASAEATPQSHSWHLEDFEKVLRMCVLHATDDRTHNSYFLFQVTGEWSTNLDYGMRDLPPGWSASEGYLPPDSNHTDPDDGSTRINGGLLVGGPVALPLGVYRAHIWVSDGRVTETTPADVVITTASWLECMQARG
jgi:hypothetical protein